MKTIFKRALLACILGMAPIAAHADTLFGFCGYHVDGTDVVYVSGIEETTSAAALNERFNAYLKNRKTTYKGCIALDTRAAADQKLKAALVEARNRNLRIIILALPLSD